MHVSFALLDHETMHENPKKIRNISRRTDNLSSIMHCFLQFEFDVAGSIGIARQQSNNINTIESPQPVSI